MHARINVHGWRSLFAEEVDDADAEDGAVGIQELLPAVALVLELVVTCRAALWRFESPTSCPFEEAKVGVTGSLDAGYNLARPKALGKP